MAESMLLHGFVGVIGQPAVSKLKKFGFNMRV
jgi:hypothetical protein